MKAKLIPLLAFAVLLSTVFVTSGHTQRKSSSGPPAKPAAARAKPTPQPTRAQTTPSNQPASATTVTEGPKPPVPLANLNGQTITTADIDQNLRREIDLLDQRIVEAKRQVLELQINTTLLQLEAEKRRMTSQQLFEIEVRKRVTAPTEAEINKVIEENRASFEGRDPAAVRKEADLFLRSEREAQLADQLVTKLRTTHNVVQGADPGNPGLAPSVVLATVGGRSITIGSLAERLKPIIYKLQVSTYMLRRDAVNMTVNNLLLLAEANRRNVPPEAIVRAEVSDKIKRPTEAEVAKFYAENRNRISGELDAVKNELAEYLVDQQQERLEHELAERLRANAKLQLLISEPPPPVQQIAISGSPSRGDANAPVTVVKFTDFECSSCAAMHPIIEEALKRYGLKVRFVVRDFPLPRHQNAKKAAEAAQAAHEQGKFFEYTALLYQRQNALDVPSLKKYATEIALDRKLFDAALDSGKYVAYVNRGLEDGEIYGIEGTPTIFVNGVLLQDLSAEGLQTAIERALKSP